MAPNTDLATRALIVSLKAGLIDKPTPTREIYALTGVSERVINLIYARAIARGFDPACRPTVLENKHLEDAPRSGRPRKDTQEVQQFIASKVRLNRYGREKTCAQLAGDLSQAGIEISGQTIWRILRRMGFKKTKPTRKPGLTKRMRDERLAWALAHQDWTLEDWKCVIFSDETAVVLGHRRGGYRVWRTTDEPFLKSCIRERWKGYTEFMF
jgi:transposase